MNCVVKIKRPNIDKTIEKNINQINWLLNVFLKIFINLKCIDISGKLKKALYLYRIQSDFINEVENWKKYDKIFSNIEGILIPKVVEEVSNNDIIVMEYISGKNLKDVNCFKDNLKLLDTINSKFMGIFITSMLNNIYHGDLHMGNFSFTEKGDIIIYDFGICFDFNESDPNDNFLMNIMDSIYTRNKDDTISIIVNGYADLNDDDKYNKNQFKITNHPHNATVASVLHLIYQLAQIDSHHIQDNRYTSPSLQVCSIQKALV